MSAIVKDYPTPASNAAAISKPQLGGRHLIILNTSGPLMTWKRLKFGD
jgi:hypothetical protein